MSSRYLFTSESVSEGHPDKVSDRISDSVVDAAIAQDPMSRVACETLCTTGLIIMSGEITTKAIIEYQELARQAVRDIGYTDPDIGFSADNCGVLISIHPQSPDISQGVTEGTGLFTEQGAGDQGMMFGYACNETPEFMPMPIHYAHRLVQTLATWRKQGVLPYLRPDAKSQVTVQYENDVPKRIDTIVVSTQHAESATLDTIRRDICERVIPEVIPAEYMDKKTRILVNPTGRFVIGGPHGDTGLTGRKIIVDTYGGMGRHGGGAFSGKDPSKVDRSACYYARYLAKNVVAAKVARRCEVQIAYAIGRAEPVSLMIDTSRTSKIPPDQIAKIIWEHFDLRPRALIDYLDLLRPIYKKTACYGHFGRNDPEFTWESTHRAEELKKAGGL